MELKPCPFCGSDELKSVLFPVEHHPAPQRAIECNVCRSRGPAVAAWDGDRDDEARTRWNDQISEKAIPDVTPYVQDFMNSGSITSGTVRLYGVSKGEEIETKK